MAATILTSEDLQDFKIELFEELKKLMITTPVTEQKQEEVK